MANSRKFSEPHHLEEGEVLTRFLQVNLRKDHSHTSPPYPSPSPNPPPSLSLSLSLFRSLSLSPSLSLSLCPASPRLLPLRTAWARKELANTVCSFTIWVAAGFHASERERGREGERERGREGEEVGQGPYSDVCAERKLVECLLVDGGLVHAENW